MEPTRPDYRQFQPHQIDWGNRNETALQQQQPALQPIMDFKAPDPQIKDDPKPKPKTNSTSNCGGGGCWCCCDLDVSVMDHSLFNSKRFLVSVCPNC